MGNRLFAVLLVGPLLLLPVQTQAGQKGTARMTTYDGRWWQQLNEEHQREVVDGFLDGALSHGATPATVVGSAEELARVYRHEPSLLSQPLATVLRIRGTPTAAAPLGGERYAGKHGFFDGDYWFQTTPDGRVGFVEGYLLATSTGDTASLAHAQRVAQSITHWYGFDRDDVLPGKGHPASTAVADVLTRVASTAR